MKKVFVFGASIVYGVGAEEIGWGDRIKRAVHEQIYSDKGLGEVAEVYNQGVPGNTTGQVVARLKPEVTPRVSSKDSVLIVLTAGLNDCKAKDSPTNFVNTPEGYRKDMDRALALVKSLTNNVTCVGFTPVDESKLSPRATPGGSSSYFQNERIRQFEDVFNEACGSVNIPFIPLFEKADSVGWQDKLWRDGLHPNDEGHDWIFQQVWPEVSKLIELA